MNAHYRWVECSCPYRQSSFESPLEVCKILLFVRQSRLMRKQITFFSHHSFVYQRIIYAQRFDFKMRMRAFCQHDVFLSPCPVPRERTICWHKPKLTLSPSRSLHGMHSNASNMQHKKNSQHQEREQEARHRNTYKFAIIKVGSFNPPAFIHYIYCIDSISMCVFLSEKECAHVL